MSNYEYPVRENSRGYLVDKEIRHINWNNVEKYIFLSKVLPLFYSKSGALLDIGAGEGQYSELFSDFSTSITLIEPDNYRLNRAKENLSRLRIKKKYINKFGQETSLNKESIDAALCVHVLQHVSEKNADKIIKNISQSLKSGGQFVLVFSENKNRESEYNISWIDNGRKMFTPVPKDIFNDLTNTIHEGVLQVRVINTDKLLKKLKKLGFSVAVNEPYIATFPKLQDKIIWSWIKLFPNVVTQHKLLHACGFSNYIDRCLVLEKN